MSEVRFLPPAAKFLKKCEDKNLKFIDYKDANRLKKYVTEKGKIISSRQTGTCSRHQRELTTAIKRARNIALLPFSGD